jgi:hypothetical protein
MALTIGETDRLDICIALKRPGETDRRILATRKKHESVSGGHFGLFPDPVLRGSSTYPQGALPLLPETLQGATQ